MATRIAELEAVIGADIGGFTRAMERVRGEINLLGNLSKTLQNVGRSMTFAFTLPIVGAAAASIKAASDFDAAMQNINSIALLTTDQLKSLSDEVLAYGMTTRGGANAAAEALYTVYSAGVTSQTQAMEIMKVATATAEAGLADMKVTVEALTASVLAYSSQNLSAATASDVLTRTVQLGVGEMMNFARALPYVTGTGAAAGIEFWELGASLAYLSQQGLPANRASRNLNSALTSLIKPAEQMKAVFREIGVNSFTELINRSGGFIQALKEITKVTGTSAEGLNEVFRNSQGARAIQLMMNDTERLTEFWDEFNESISGSTAQAREEQMKSFAAQWDLLKSAVEGFSITLGQRLMPVLAPLMGLLREFILTMAGLPPEVLSLGIAFAGLLATIGPVLWAMGMMLSPVNLLVAGIGALAAALTMDFGGLRTSIVEALPGLTTVQTIIDEITGILSGVTIDPPETPSVIPVADLVTIEGTIWDSWVKDNHGMSWEEFRGAVTDQLGGIVVPEGGITINLGEKSIDLQATHGSPWAIDRLPDIEIPDGGLSMVSHGTPWAIKQLPPPVLPPTFFDRFMQAWEEKGPELIAAVNTLVGQVGPALTVAFETVVAPVLNTLGSRLFDGLAGIFAPQMNQRVEASGGAATGGNTPFFQSIKTFFETGLGEVVGSVGTYLTKHFPDLTTAVQTFFANFGDWVVNTGLPTLARTIGYAIGTIGALIGSAVGLIFSGLGNTQENNEGREAAGAIIGNLWDELNTGFQEGAATGGADITSGVESIITGIAGLFGTIALVSFAGSLISGGFITAIGGGISAALGLVKLPFGATSGLSGIIAQAFGGLKWGVGAINTVASSVTQLLGLGLGGIGAGTAALVVGGVGIAALIGGYLFNEDVRKTVNEAGQSIADALFGEGFTERARVQLQTALAPILDDPIKRIITSDIQMQVGAGTLDPMTAATQIANLWGTTVDEEFAKLQYEGLVDGVTTALSTPDPAALTTAVDTLALTVQQMMVDRFGDIPYGDILGYNGGAPLVGTEEALGLESFLGGLGFTRDTVLGMTPAELDTMTGGALAQVLGPESQAQGQLTLFQETYDNMFPSLARTAVTAAPGVGTAFSAIAYAGVNALKPLKDELALIQGQMTGLAASGAQIIPVGGMGSGMTLITGQPNGGGNNTTNNITLNQATDLDRYKLEMARRGVIVGM